MMALRKLWKALPGSVRKTIVLVIGSTLIVLGAALIVLPGPFTMPLVILGLVILAVEFTWAESLLTKAKFHAKKIDPRKLRKRS
ncbi:MAG: PGPGW domain-containing protein [Candidatus Nanopelagicaceae bacterium]|nr:PGPGW domain-containing protein [Candidatus Nanopelagicaceae bacterium]